MSPVDPRLWPAVRPLLDRALHLQGEDRRRFVERTGAINEAVHTVLVHLLRTHERLGPVHPQSR